MGFMPEVDDCEDALEACRDLVDVYEPPMGSMVGGGGLDYDDDDDSDEYFDGNED